ncbi:MAG: hypothetical protein GC138_03105 [Gammaproteobacteria bacterium]|nr:hypothetical protein [Gammaproteobacteria bacterium]
MSDADMAVMPRIRRDDDIFLVSFPRSGNTWVSFMLANIMIEKLELDVRVNLFNIHGFVPDIHQGQDIPEHTGFFPFKRIIKSHAEFTPDYKNIIYLTRDPRSVMASYHVFLTKLGFVDMSVSEFIRNPSVGIEAWVRHVDGWMNQPVPGTRIRLFSYESFLSDFAGNVQELAFLLGFTLNGEQVDRITDRCSFAHMKELEKTTASLANVRHDKQFAFVRQGSSSSWDDTICEEDIAYIREVAGEWMDRYDYA